MSRSLAELQARVHALFCREADLDATAVALSVPSDRLGIYRDFVRGHVTRALAKVHPLVVALLGARWDALADAFFHEVPATARELNACAAPFASWLGRRTAVDATLPPWAPALALVEWELFAAWAHEADVPGPPSDIEVSEPPSAAGPSDFDASLATNPTLAIVSAPWALVPWLVAHPDASLITPETPGPAPLPAPQLALVFRRAGTHRVAFHVGSDDLLFALKVVAQRVPLARAAAHAQAPIEVARRALIRAIDLGLVVAGANG